MSDLRQGRIAWIELADRNGHNKYHRPVVILTATEEIPFEDELVCVVASHSAAVGYAPRESYVPIPYHPQGLVRSKLKKPTVAVCEWLVSVAKRDLGSADLAGVVEPKVLKKIIQMVDLLHSRRQSENDD